MHDNKVFDQIAGNYDEDFSFTKTGKAQRNIVQNYLVKRIIKGYSVLEVNCGTGEDAFFLSANGCQVLATDASDKMIARCIDKQVNKSDRTNPEFRVLSFNGLSVLKSGKKWDMIFSDFSGLNCLDYQEINELPELFHSLSKPGGRLIMVVFGKKCLWEKFYMLLKGRFSQVSRRNSVNRVKMPDGEEMKVYYYAPREMIRIFSGYFDFVRKRPVGFFVPPSYLDSFFRNHGFVFKLLEVFERFTCKFSFLSDFSDHYIIEFKAG